MKKSVKTALYLILILMAAVSAFQGARNALRFSQDFQYDAALLLRSGINPYLESLEPAGGEMTGPAAEFFRIFEEAGAPQKVEANQFPSLLMLLFPMTLLPYPASRVLWLVLNLCFTAAIILLLKQTFFKKADRDVFNILMLLMIAGTPWRNQIGVGQHSLFSFCFFLLSVWLSDNDHKVLSGLALSVSYFKYTLTAPLAVDFLYKRKYKEFVISLIPHALGTVAGALMLKSSVTDMVILPLKVASALAGEGSIDIGALTGGAGWSLALTLIIMLGLVIAAFRFKEGEDNSIFSLLILFSLIMTYHRIYDFFMLIPAAAGTWFGDRRVNHKLFLLMYGINVIYFFFVQRFTGEGESAVSVSAFLYYGYLILYILSLVLKEKREEGYAG